MMNKLPQYKHSLNQLVTAYRHGDDHALKKLIARFHPQIVRCLRHTAGTDAPIDDLAQDCWYSIVSRMADLELQISFSAFALTIARRRAIDWIRYRQRQRRLYDTTPLSSDAMAANGECPEPSFAREKHEDMTRIHEGIQQLPPTQQVVLSMFYLEERRLTQIADELNISTGTVKSRLFYARESLKRYVTGK